MDPRTASPPAFASRAPFRPFRPLRFARALLLSLASLAPLVTLLGATGCASGLQLRQVDAAQEKPANVLLLFRVTSDHGGVTGLQDSAFTVKEDDHVVGPGVDRVIVNPDLRAAQATMVLVDLGGRPTSDELDALSGAVTVLVERLGPGKRVALYALDGAGEPQVLAPFGASLDVLRAAADKIPAYKTRDPSLDLNGSYVSALRTLKQVASSTNGPKIANLVLFARGPDRAARVDTRAVKTELRGEDLDLSRYVLGFGPDAPAAKLDLFGDRAPAFATTVFALRDAATQTAAAIDERGKSFYLLSYCTAARGGQHRVKLEASRERTTPEGKPQVDTGSLSYTFKADGFGAGCTPSVPDGWKTQPPETTAVRAGAREGAKPVLAGAIPVR